MIELTSLAASEIVTFLGLSSAQWAFVTGIVALNFFVLWALRQITLRISLSEVLAEKGPGEIDARAKAIEQSLKIRAAAKAAATKKWG